MIFDHDNSITMYYDVYHNYFVDGMGHVIERIFDWLTPNELFVFLVEKEDRFILRANNTYVDLIFPEYLPY